jgi:hypothetical protein
MVYACAVARSQMVNPSHFIFLKTTPPCPAGSRAWKSLFGSVACGLSETFSPSALAFIARLAAMTAVAGVSFFYSPILSLKSLSFKSLLSLAGICAISTPNTIASSTSSNSTRGPRSSPSHPAVSLTFFFFLFSICLIVSFL